MVVGRALQQMLLSRYKDKIIVEEIVTPTQTGLFEVQIEGDKLAWSKLVSMKRCEIHFAKEYYSII